jgi:hypothetical protein
VIPSTITSAFIVAHVGPIRDRRYWQTVSSQTHAQLRRGFRSGWVESNAGIPLRGKATFVLLSVVRDSGIPVNVDCHPSRRWARTFRDHWSALFWQARRQAFAPYSIQILSRLGHQAIHMFNLFNRDGATRRRLGTAGCTSTTNAKITLPLLETRAMGRAQSRGANYNAPLTGATCKRLSSWSIIGLPG